MAVSRPLDLDRRQRDHISLLHHIQIDSFPNFISESSTFFSSNPNPMLERLPDILYTRNKPTCLLHNYLLNRCNEHSSHFQTFLITFKYSPTFTRVNLTYTTTTYTTTTVHYSIVVNDPHVYKIHTLTTTLYSQRTSTEISWSSPVNHGAMAKRY